MGVQISASFSSDIGLPASQVWSRMNDYGDLDWAMEAGIEAVELEGEGIGMVRKVHMTGMEEPIRERLVASDEEAMIITYVIDEDGFPGLSDYVASAKVIPQNGTCRVRWIMHAKVADSELEAMKLGLQAMAEGLVTLFAAQFGE